MKLGVSLKAAEKVFGPALPGHGPTENTVSAIKYVSGRSTKYGGVAGILDDAKFYIHFPTPVDWNLLTTKNGTPDFVSDLKESGPQGEQGREALVAEFMDRLDALRAAQLEKKEAAAKKAAEAQRKAELQQEASAQKAAEAQRKAELQKEAAAKKAAEAQRKAELQQEAAAKKAAEAQRKAELQQEVAAKKAAEAQRKIELDQERLRLKGLAGEREATLLIGSESFSLKVKIAVDKAGKVKISAAL